VYQTAFLDADVYKTAKVGDVVDNPGQDHT
jgi:hypothetical protein